MEETIKGRRRKHDTRVPTKFVPVSQQTYAGYVALKGPTTSRSTTRVSALAASSSSTRNGMYWSVCSVCWCSPGVACCLGHSCMFCCLVPFCLCLPLVCCCGLNTARKNTVSYANTGLHSHQVSSLPLFRRKSLGWVIRVTCMDINPLHVTCMDINPIHVTCMDINPIHVTCMDINPIHVTCMDKKPYTCNMHGSLYM